MVKKGQYTLTFKGRVQEAGFRGYTGDIGRQLGIAGIVYNVGADTVKVLCEGNSRTVTQFYKVLQQYRLAEISEAKIEEGIQLPYPPYRAVAGLEQEIYDRLDFGVRLLEGIKEDTKLLEGVKEDTKLLEGVKEDTGSMKETLPRIENILKEISGKL